MANFLAIEKYILFILTLIVSYLKLTKLRDIAKRTKTAVIGTSESKLDRTILDPEIYIENYEIPRFDRNRK